MSPTVPIAMFGWPLVVLVLFTLMPARRAVLVGVLVAWLFLPIAGYSLAGLPDITKMSITCLSVFIGTVVFDTSRLIRLRWSWADLAMLAWVTVPVASAVSAGYGAYEGVSAAFDATVTWGLPYLIGRMYFSDAAAMRDLAMALCIGGLVYAPLVLFEARMSPQLHTWVYGFHQHVFAQSKRSGGWRPTVFMTHGLAVAMFMSTAALAGLWMASRARERAIPGLPAWLPPAGLLVVAAGCRSTYALMLMVVGMAAAVVGRMLGTRVFVLVLLLIAPTYIAARTVGGWDAGELRSAAMVFGPDRAESLAVRLDSEDTMWRWIQSDLLVGRSRIGSLLIDSGAWGRFIPDGLWLIALGKHGLVGLVAMFGVLVLPCALYVARTTPSEFFGPALAGATAVMLLVVLYTLDFLLNASVNPLPIMGAGGLAVLRPVRAAVAIPAQWTDPAFAPASGPGRRPPSNVLPS
jgi:O-antigen ligase